MAKRERDETAVETAVQELEAAVQRDADIKLKAVQTISGLVDQADEGYTAQREAAENGALTLLMQLLEDDAESVRVEAAKALTVLCQHSPSAMSRVHVGKTTGFSQTPEKVSLNPVQESVIELDGVFKPNTTAALRELVHRLLQHEPKALEPLEGMLAGLDVRDDMAVLLDQALSPTLTFLRNGECPEKLDAVTLLGSVCEKRPGAAAFLVAEGALPAVATLMTSDDLSTRDAAAHTLWLLVRDNKKLLSPAKDALGLPGTQLVEPLLALVEAREDQETAEDQEGDDDDDDEDDKVTDAGVVAVDNGDDALLLLRALAAYDADVREKLKGQTEILGARCSIM
eukprot:gene9367-9530_t